MRRERAILDPTKLIVDEADRLQMASLEQLRAIFDESEIGFVHEFWPLSQSEMRRLLLQRWNATRFSAPKSGEDRS
jgi:hypothetical protein